MMCFPQNYELTTDFQSFAFHPILENIVKLVFPNLTLCHLFQDSHIFPKWSADIPVFNTAPGYLCCPVIHLLP